MEWKWCRPNGT